MKEYIASEFLKEKRQRNKHLAVVCWMILMFFLIKNVYHLTSKAGILDLYCDNVQIYIFITLMFSILYTMVLFGDEYRNGTIYQLQMIPIVPLKFILAKILMVICFNSLIMMTTTIGCIFIIGIKGLNLTSSSIAILLFINLADSLLLSMVMFPIALFAILYKENYIVSLLLNISYIMLGLMMPSLPLKQEIAQKLTAYLHPLGSYALIHNWFIYKFVPYETSMLSKPKESAVVAFLGMLIWSVICCGIMELLMKKKKKKEKIR